MVLGEFCVRPFNIYNTLSRKVEEIRPLHEDFVTFYSCGPTVYLPQHLGNMRAYLFVDFFKRALEFNGWPVRHVMNVTDVGHMTSDADTGEDKIEKTARAEGRAPLEVANEYLRRFLADLARLNVQLPTVLCRATDHVGDMTALIERLLARKFAYIARSGVYFDVEKYRGASRIGRLSHQSLDEQNAAQRLEHASDKRSPHDFALWVLNHPEHLMQWDSPWGRGYPGWHIECSAMAMRYLGETVDIHTGGLDHIPVHHENEIAQSESATGKPFVRYFVHNAFLMNKEGAKISKSAGRFPLLDDLVARGISPLAFRLLCFGAKYRSQLLLDDAGLEAAQKNLDYLMEFPRAVDDAIAASPDSEWVSGHAERFHAALNDDLNTPEALAAVRELVGEAYRRGDFRIWNAMVGFDRVMGLGLEERRAALRRAAPPSDIQAMIDERDRARRQRNWALSDKLRREMEALGWTVRDRPDGTSDYSLR